MSDLKPRCVDKAAEFTRQVTADRRWKLEDELMCQVFGFTAYGYAFGFGRVHCLLDVADIHTIVADQLAGLGIGRRYAEGLVETAHREFEKENNRSWQNQLIEIGHSHALNEDMEVLVNSVFSNAAALRKATHQPWWKFWK